VNIGGFQYKVQKDMQLKVPRLSAEEGASVDLDHVLLVSNGDDVQIGKPLVEGAKVSAEVLEHGKHRKVMVVKKKRRKGYKRRNGHRQLYTAIRITGIHA